MFFNVGAGHHHGPPTVTRAFVLGVFINSAFVVIEAGAGFFLGSIALLTDAGHNLADVGSLLVGLVAARLAEKRSSSTYTYGLGKSTVLAALINATFLLVSTGAIGYAAMVRLTSPVPVAGEKVALVAFIGIIINGASALLFFKDRHHDLNVRAAYLHLLADAGISLGVVVAGFVVYFTGWMWFDPAVGILVGVAILYGAFSLMRDALRLSLDGVPPALELSTVRDYLLSVDRVCDVHDLHVWAMSTTETALTAHLVTEDTASLSFEEINEELYHRFHISHATLQVEPVGGVDCRQRC